MSGSTSAAAGSSTVDDEHHINELAAAAADANLIIHEDQALLALKSDLMAKLNKEVKSLDDDNWMFDGPRSHVHLISGPGGLRHRHTEISTRRDIAPRK